jgi:hypothetical protein
MVMVPARVEPESDCSENYRPDLLSERALYIKKTVTGDWDCCFAASCTSYNSE